MPIEGMTCTSCVSRITRALRKVDGVDSVRVDLATDSATVAFDPKRTSLARIGQAVDRAGYHARVEQSGPVSGDETRTFLSRWGLRRG